LEHRSAFSLRIETSRFALIGREAHSSEEAVENRQSGPDLAVAGGFGRAAALSYFSAPPRLPFFACPASPR